MAFRDAAGAIGDEAAANSIEFDRVAFTRRASELRNTGLITPTGTTRDTKTGRLSMLCVITPEGLKALAPGERSRAGRRAGPSRHLSSTTSRKAAGPNVEDGWPETRNAAPPDDGGPRRERAS
jgi:hypothetical protein